MADMSEISLDLFSFMADMSYVPEMLKYNDTKMLNCCKYFLLHKYFTF